MTSSNYSFVSKVAICKIIQVVVRNVLHTKSFSNPLFVVIHTTPATNLKAILFCKGGRIFILLHFVDFFYPSIRSSVHCRCFSYLPVFPHSDLLFFYYLFYFVFHAIYLLFFRISVSSWPSLNIFCLVFFSSFLGWNLFYKLF